MLTPSFEPQPPSHNLRELKADLFSILQTAEFLIFRYQKGMVEEEVFYKQMGRFQEELRQIEQELAPSNKSILEIINNFDNGEHLKDVFKEIGTAADYLFDQENSTWNYNPVNLASAAAQVTSSFITLLDYVHLVEQGDLPFLLELIEKLLQNLQKFEIFYPFLMQVITLRNEILETIRPYNDSLKIPDDVLTFITRHADGHFFRIHQNFQNFLNT